MSRAPRFAVLALVGLAGASCQTSERLWRISPFETEAAPDRVNLWPLAYHSGDETSILWPIFDVDDKGFALRPLIAKNGTAYSVLYPFASFDTQTTEGWIFPFYRFGGNQGLFPALNLGRFNWVGPVWWTEESSGLFPVAGFGRFNYVGPVWWKSEGEHARSGLFPLAMFGRFNYVGPAWWTEGGESYGFFPLFGTNLFSSGVNHVGPFWWRREADGGRAGGLFPLVSYARGGDDFWLFPFYSHELTPNLRTRSYLFGLGHTYAAKDVTRRWLLPFYYHRDEPDKKDTALLPFYWKRVRGDRAQVFTLFGHRSVDPESTSFNLYPLWWSNETKDSSWRMLFPFFYYSEEGDERTLLMPLGGRGWSESGATAFFNVLGPLYHHSRSLRRDESRTAFLWPLFERHRKGDQRTTRLAGLYSSTSSPDASSFQYAFGLGHGARDATGSSHRLWPLYSVSNQDELPGWFYRWTLFGQHSSGDKTERHLFPVFASTSAENESSWDALLGLAHYDERHARDAEGERWWVWPLISRSKGRRGLDFAGATTLISSSSWEGGSRFQIGASLLYSKRTEVTGSRRNASSRALGLFTHDEEEFVGRHIPVARPMDRENRIRHHSRGFFFDAFVSSSSTYRVWSDDVVNPREAMFLRAMSRRHPETPAGEVARQADAEKASHFLRANGIELFDDDPQALLAAIDDFTEHSTETLDYRKIRIPLIYGYERTGHRLEWQGPLGLVQYESEENESKFSLLYFGYRSETKGARTSRDIFPFITWDTGPGEMNVSFLWRLFRYEREGEKRGGHLFFIPWGST